MMSFFLFIADALAEGGDDMVAASAPSFASFIPIIAVFAIFYFLIIRPQQKKVKVHNLMLKNIKKGDKVVTSGGLVGLVNKIDELNSNSVLMLEVANGLEVKVMRNAVSEVVNASVS